MREIYEKLRKTAQEVNDASNGLNGPIHAMNDALKEMNLGVQVWVTVDDNLELGYAKVDGAWGISIREVEAIHVRKSWLFSKAPRAYRIVAVEELPALVRALTIAAENLAIDLRQHSNRAKTIVQGLLGL